MKKVFINYADKVFEKQQKFALKAARFRGKFDAIYGFTRQDIDEIFYIQHKYILNQKRGGGYWLWKPYFINKSLSTLNNGDYLFYSDAGAFFLKKVDILIDELNKYDQDIMGFELPLIEEQWTKKELFIRMNCEESFYFESNQILASFMLIKKTNFSEKFFNEFLKISCDEINITDKFLENVKQNDDFICHRWDQSIFSLLYKKYNLKPFKDPSQFGELPTDYISSSHKKIDLSENICRENGRKFRIKEYPEKYKFVILHYRGGGSGKPINSLIKYYLKVYFPIIYDTYLNIVNKLK